MKTHKVVQPYFQNVFRHFKPTFRCLLTAAFVLTSPNGFAEPAFNGPDYSGEVLEYFKKMARGEAPPPKPMDLSEIEKQKPIMLGHMAEMFGIEKNSREWAHLMKAQLAYPGSPKITWPEIKRPSSTQFPIAHYRFDTDTKLPSQEAIQKVIHASNSNLQIGRKIRAKPSRKKEERKPPREIPKCPISSSETVRLPKSYLHHGKIFDILVFDGKPPFDTKLGIGKKTAVLTYNSESDGLLAQSLSGMSIPCLPFRMRSLGDTVVYGVGAEALKNFDADSKGPGTFDPTVLAYIKQSEL